MLIGLIIIAVPAQAPSPRSPRLLTIPPHTGEPAAPARDGPQSRGMSGI